MILYIVCVLLLYAIKILPFGSVIWIIDVEKSMKNMIKIKQPKKQENARCSLNSFEHFTQYLSMCTRAHACVYQFNLFRKTFMYRPTPTYRITF